MGFASDELLKLNQQLCELAKFTLSSFIAHLKKSKIDLHTTYHILLAYYHKAVDLFDGIIKLQQCGLIEDAQILIRVLFETNLNVGCLIKLSNTNIDDAANIVMASIIIMKAKDASQQKFDISNLSKIAEAYSSHYSENDIKMIKRYGFTRCSIHQRAKNDNKEEWYNIMFKNFSRNVHAFDFIEYFVKLGLRDDEESYEEMHILRNQAALEHTHKCFYQIIRFCNLTFEWGIDDELKDIHTEFNRLADSKN
jgi:Family of unknown function (DUF5677)